MCGIAGIVSWQALEPQDQNHVASMCAALAHRGPDGASVVRSGIATLGHARLKVLDLSDRATQPMSDESGTVWIAFNGEIYNHQRLRAELEPKHTFRSRTDSEVIVHGYEEWGFEGLLDKLRGMFAIALWDFAGEVLWLARDRLGVKPLVFSHDSNVTRFCSETLPLMRWHQPTATTIDHVALDHLLTFGHLPANRHLVRTVRKLAPASFVRIDRRGITERTYWTAPFPEEDGQVGLRKLEALLRDAVSVRLEADVPLGFFVSGGIDSSLVLALADSECTRDRVAITARFGGAQDDADFRRAELATQQAHIRHTIVDCEEPRLEDLPALIAIAGEPLADPSLLPSAAVCRAARRDVTVALTGDGGDELFCGYNRVASVHLAETIRRRFGSGGLTLSSAAGRLSWLSPAFGRLSTVASFGSEDLATLYAEKGAAFPESERRVLYRPGLVDSVRPLPTTTGLRESVARFPKMSAADGFLRLDLQNRLAGRYLQKLDVASSAAGLECRSPFVDQHLVESAMSIPAAAKMPWGRQKGLLRELSRRVLPLAIAKGPKRGFAKSTSAMIRARWRSVESLLTKPRISSADGVLSEQGLKQVLASHANGERDRSEQIWVLICFEIWWQVFVDHRLPADLADELGQSA